MERIKDTIETIIKELTQKKSVGKAGNPQEWLKKILTKKELGHIKLHYFRKGTLGLKVDSSAWLYSLNLKQEALLSRLKKFSSEVKNIRLSIGDVR